MANYSNIIYAASRLFFLPESNRRLDFDWMCINCRSKAGNRPFVCWNNEEKWRTTRRPDYIFTKNKDKYCLL